MPAVIEVQHLHKSYGDTVAVDDVSFTVADGEIFGILGRNGAGKTTTVECVEGLQAPNRGEIRVLGLDPRRDRAELTQRLGAQLQDSQLPDGLRVAEAITADLPVGPFGPLPAHPVTPRSPGRAAAPSRRPWRCWCSAGSRRWPSWSWPWASPSTIGSVAGVGGASGAGREGLGKAACVSATSDNGRT